MVQTKELGIFRSRIVMALTLEEYQIAQMYVVMKMQQQSATGTEGVEVLENKSYEDDEYGKGQYTLKLYRLQSKAPTWLTAFAPKEALIIQEESWNAFPRCKSVIKCPYFDRVVLSIDTIHKADNGLSENVHCLSDKQLEERTVEAIDIASSPSDYWSNIIGRTDVDFSTFQSERTGRGPLLDGWQRIPPAFRRRTNWALGGNARLRVYGCDDRFYEVKIEAGEITDGWLNFVRENDLKVGEYLMFELDDNAVVFLVMLLSLDEMQRPPPSRR